MDAPKNTLLYFFSTPIKESKFIFTRLPGLSPKKETKPQKTTTPELPKLTTETTFLRNFWQAQREGAHLTTRNLQPVN